MEIVSRYFPELSGVQHDQYAELKGLYEFWNSQINVISRKDMDNFYERHVLHSLGIAKVVAFLQGAKVMDVGTGGGFPGIPLAIMFPEVNFLLVDSIGKKIKVAQEVAKAIGLTNLHAVQQRAEDVKHRFDFVVSRAVTTMPEFLKWTERSILPLSKHSLANGILYLKGGDLAEELSTLKNKYRVFELSEHFGEEFFLTKKVVHVSV